MKIIIGSDHRGIEHKNFIKDSLVKNKLSVEDVGCYNLENKVDYPKIVELLAHQMQLNIHNAMGVLICGSGIGVSIAANRYNFLRAALVYNESVAKLARNHNNANVICLGADFMSPDVSSYFVDIFIDASFDAGRHLPRVEALKNMK